MPHRGRVTFLLLVGLFAGNLARIPSRATAQSAGCDGARAAIATLSDPSASAVSLDPLGQQVVDLDNWPPPQYLYDNLRAGGVESHVYAVTAELVGTTLQPNGDFDLLLAQPGDERWTIIAVLPDPSRCPGAAASPEAADIANARGDVAATIGLHSGGLPPALTIVRVTGAGFFNPLVGGPGEAGNGLELSPVIRFALAGPATLTTFPVMAAGSSAGLSSTTVSPNAQPPISSNAAVTGVPITGPSSSPPPDSQPASSNVPASTAPVANSPAAAPATSAVSAQQISDALASNAPAGAELPSPFGSAVLESAGPGSGPTANAYDLDFLLIGSGGQPGGALTYLVFASSGDAQSALSALQGVLSQSGLSPQPAAGLGPGSFCAQPAASSPAPCAAMAGSVLVLTQAADSATAQALAQAGLAHLTRVLPAPS